ncbi:Uncharacterised protein [Bordetella pertussis]|nr:Uncharacterised protein [Bordetella pertussis]
MLLCTTPGRPRITPATSWETPWKPWFLKRFDGFLTAVCRLFDNRACGSAKPMKNPHGNLITGSAYSPQLLKKTKADAAQWMTRSWRQKA